MTNLPGRCMGCGADVWYRGPRYTIHVWRNRDGKAHTCPADRPTCGAWMPVARERCERRPGHEANGHRSAYAIKNARAARAGRGIIGVSGQATSPPTIRDAVRLLDPIERRLAV